MSNQEFEKNLDAMIETTRKENDGELEAVEDAEYLKMVEEWKENRDREMRSLAFSIHRQKLEIAELQSDLKEMKKCLEETFQELHSLALAEPPKKSEQMTINLEYTNDEWLKKPVSELEGLTENQLEKLSERFKTIGEVVEWVGDDFSEKIPGIGEAVKDKIREACNIAAGITSDKIREIAEVEKAKRLNNEVHGGPENEVHRDPIELEALRLRCQYILDEVFDPEFDDEFVRSVLEQIDNEEFYTDEQARGIENVERVFLN